MTPKQLKFLSLFEAMSKADNLAEANVKKHLTSFINHDYALALDVWDYLASTREQTLASDKEAAQTIGAAALDLFYKKAAQKTVKAISDLPAVRRAV